VSDKEVVVTGNLYVAPALIEKYEFIKIAISGLSSFLNITGDSLVILFLKPL